MVYEMEIYIFEEHTLLSKESKSERGHPVELCPEFH